MNGAVKPNKNGRRSLTNKRITLPNIQQDGFFKKIHQIFFEQEGNQ